MSQFFQKNEKKILSAKNWDFWFSHENKPVSRKYFRGRMESKKFLFGSVTFFFFAFLLKLNSRAVFRQKSFF